jgi:hypothetical protein
VRHSRHAVILLSLAAGLLAALLILPGWGVLAQGDSLPTATPTLQPTLPPRAALPEVGMLEQRCGAGVSPRGPDFAASGLLLTTFSRDALWVVDLDRNMRYPLPETRPCGPNCRPSPDRTRLLYVSAETATFWLMNADGTQRESIFPYYISELDWWDADHWIVWPTAGRPALYPVGVLPQDATPERLDDYDSYSIQPGGYHGLRLEPGTGEWPLLELVDLTSGLLHPLAEARPYLSGAYWSPDGSQLAYIGQGAWDDTLNRRGAELFVIAPGQSEAVQVTDLTAAYGAVRITGEIESGAVSWSPDGRYLAFWVMEIIGPDPAANVGQAVVHVLDLQTGRTIVYCGFGTNHTNPSMPELVWSPDGAYIAFGVDEPGDGRPPILFVLDTVSGDYTEVTEGMYAAYGTYDPVMWAR